MRRIGWLSWLSSSVLSSMVIVAGASLLLSPASLNAEPPEESKLDEAKVKAALLQRFDENRNDKLDAGEARQSRARLKNLLEDKSEREINILTWREDVRELLQSIDPDADNRLSIAECDTGRELLDRLIPEVDPTAAKERGKSKSASDKKDKDAEGDNDGFQRRSRGSGGGYGGRRFGNAMGGGGFGNSAFGNMSGERFRSGMRPGMGDSGSSLGAGYGGAMAGGAGAASGFGNGESSPSNGSGKPSGEGRPSPSDWGPLGDDRPKPGMIPGSTPGQTAPTGGASGTKPGNKPSTRPDSLGGGRSPPAAGSAGGPGGTSAVPSNPKPNF